MALAAQLQMIPPSIPAMRYLVRAAKALYEGELTAYIGTGASVPVLRSAIDPPGVFSWHVGGETVVCIPGTTTFSEIVQQGIGWVFPSALPPGAVNRYYAGLSAAIFPTLPNHVDVLFGHSMGAALAMSIGRRYVQAGLHPPVVFGFGCPRAFTLPVAGDSSWPPIVSLVNEFDIVPQLVPDVDPDFVWRTPPLNEWVISPIGLVNRNQPVGTLASLAILAAAVTDEWHAVDKYLSLLIAPQPTALVFGAAAMPTVPIFEFEVLGTLDGQACNNAFKFEVEGGDVPSVQEALIAFRQQWRTWILPRVSDTYQVDRYFAAKNPSILVVPQIPPLADKLVMRWAENTVVAGGTDDAGVFSGNILPSYVACNFTKALGVWQVHDDTDAIIPQRKIGRGSFRISGIAEADTVASGNEFTAPYVALMQQSASALRRFFNADTGTQYRMVVTSTRPDGVPLLDAGPPVTAKLAYAVVFGIAPDRVVSSQLSRKKKKGGA